MANIYTGTMGMISFQTKLEVAGNNIANSRTTGFKKDQETFKVFEEGMRRIISKGNTGNIGPYQEEVHIDDIATNYNAGLIEVTNRSLDVSLQDKRNENGEKSVSFFEVEAAGENLLTRDGHFSVDSEGYLSLMNGAYVLDEQGQRINIPTDSNVAISDAGEIVDSSTGAPIAKLMIRSVNENDTGFLEKANGSMFRVINLNKLTDYYGGAAEMLRAYDGNPSLQKIFRERSTLENILNTNQIDLFVPNANVIVKQQTLEKSNVDLSEEMNQLLIAQKGFQANVKVATTFDRINEKDANQLGV